MTRTRKALPVDDDAARVIIGRMILKHIESVEKQNFTMAGAEGVQMQLLCGPGDGAPTFAMRKFIVAAGGYTPRHYHDFEHEILVLAGEGVVFGNGKEQRVKAGDVLYVPANEVHQLRNGGSDVFEFICLVPAFVHKPGAPMPTAVDCASDAMGAVK
jgi:quercetin dioxygenase-like cupin family protein